MTRRGIVGSPHTTQLRSVNKIFDHHRKNNLDQSGRVNPLEQVQTREMCIGIGSFTVGSLNSKDPEAFTAIPNYDVDADTRRTMIDNSIDGILSDSVEKSIDRRGPTDYDCENSFNGISKRTSNQMN